MVDTGIGIDPETLPHVFDTFAQADRSLDRSRGGLGLGLALVKGLVEMHGGTVSAWSDGPGRGSEFTIRLPLAELPDGEIERGGEGARRSGYAHPGVRCQGREGEKAPRPVAPSPHRPVAPPSPRLPVSSPPAADLPPRVLLIEDNLDAAYSLRDLLEVEGCTVTVVHSGPAGLTEALHAPPEVVICDIGLPGMDGYQVAAALRREPATASVRLIALSGYGREQDRRRSREAGFDAHLTKPVDFALLRRILQTAPLP